MRQIQRALRKLGIPVERNIIQGVKNYIFDSQGIAFTYPNYIAWRRLVTKKGLIGDAAFVLHEMAEVEELQRIQRQTGFDFMGRKVGDSIYRSKRSRRERKHWHTDFNRYYKEAHSKALEAEYQFIASQVESVTNGIIKISFLQAAAIDPTRDDEALTNLFVDGVAMQHHYNFETWRQRANEIVPLSKKMQQRLRCYLSFTRLEDIIRLVKMKRIE